MGKYKMRLLILLILFCPIVMAEIPEETAVNCIMGEARGEGEIGMQAVGEVLRRRNSTQGVYGCNATFKEPEHVWNRARRAWKASERSNLTKGATHFESTDFKAPFWAKSLQEVARVGKHVFYR